MHQIFPLSYLAHLAHRPEEFQRVLWGPTVPKLLYQAYGKVTWEVGYLDGVKNCQPALVFFAWHRDGPRTLPLTGDRLRYDN